MYWSFDRTALRITEPYALARYAEGEGLGTRAESPRQYAHAPLASLVGIGDLKNTTIVDQVARSCFFEMGQHSFGADK
jgi:hypothetical protein